jgi:hypothetical protein
MEPGCGRTVRQAEDQPRDPTAMTSVPEMRCSEWATENAVGLLGSAGSYEGFCLVEWPMPWPRDAKEVPELAPIIEVLEKGGHRLQLISAGQMAADAMRQVIVYRKANEEAQDRSFSAYRRSSRVCPPHEIPNVAQELLGEAQEKRSADSEVIDVLICTHGRRDICCGSMGTALFADVTKSPVDWQGQRKTQIWRTSHTGGHRFAPTAIVLPQGTLWGRLATETLRRVVAQEGPLSQVMGSYRGCAGLPTAELQVLEAAIFESEGWTWTSLSKRGSVDETGDVTMSATEDNGETRSWAGKVVTQRLLPVPPCRQPLSGSEKLEPEFGLRHFRRT